jgi:Zn finger protein HypA/HybF involved in hydrogenase expression
MDPKFPVTERLQAAREVFFRIQVAKDVSQQKLEIQQSPNLDEATKKTLTEQLNALLRDIAKDSESSVTPVKRRPVVLRKVTFRCPKCHNGWIQEDLVTEGNTMVMNDSEFPIPCDCGYHEVEQSEPVYVQVAFPVPG